MVDRHLRSRGRPADGERSLAILGTPFLRLEFDLLEVQVQEKRPMRKWFGKITTLRGARNPTPVGTCAGKENKEGLGKALALLVARPARPPVGANHKMCGKLRRTAGACEGRFNGRETKIVPTKCVLANKGGTDKADIVARMVACEINGD